MFLSKNIIPLFLTLALCPLWLGNAQAPLKGFNVAKVVHKIKAQQKTWIALKANLSLTFQKSTGEDARCEGTLLYHRVDERMLLKCYGEHDDLVFIFRTRDTAFDLYLPDQHTVFHGNIFDLEDTTSLNSHLKPLALYRALKMNVISVENAQLTLQDNGLLHLEIFQKESGRSYLARELTITSKGEVLKEIYYGTKSDALTSIQRFNYQTYENTKKDPISYPKEIILSVSEKSLPNSLEKTTLLFNEIQFLGKIDTKVWSLTLPKNTKRTTVRATQTPTFADVRST